jgi:hypothetical protein
VAAEHLRPRRPPLAPRKIAQLAVDHLVRDARRALQEPIAPAVPRRAPLAWNITARTIPIRADARPRSERRGPWRVVGLLSEGPETPRQDTQTAREELEDMRAATRNSAVRDMSGLSTAARDRLERAFLDVLRRRHPGVTWAVGGPREREQPTAASGPGKVIGGLPGQQDEGTLVNRKAAA